MILRTASAFRVVIVIAAASIGAATGHAQVETNDPGIVSGTLARIKTTGTVRLGYRDASIPFSYLDRSGRPIGYSIDICNAIVDEIGRTLDREDLKIDFVKVTSETRLPLVVDGTIELECGPVTTNQQALKSLDQKFKLGIMLIESPDHEESYRMLADRQADAFATDDVLLYG